MKNTVNISELIDKLQAIITDPEKKRKLLILSSVQLKDLLAGYPVAGRWNEAPGTNNDNRWYQRGYGSRWKRKNGTLGGTNNSEQLQKNWNVESLNSFNFSVFTDVTYAPFLLDRSKQVYWASEHGWKDTDEVIEEFMPQLEENILAALDAEIDKI